MFSSEIAGVKKFTSWGIDWVTREREVGVASILLVRAYVLLCSILVALS